MKRRKKRNVLIILLSTFFTCFICLFFSGNLENNKEKINIKVQEDLEDDPLLMIYKEKYKKRHASLWKHISLYPKEVFLTFDDGPSINNTLRIIDILNHNGVKATFFVIGQRVEAYPDIIKKMDASRMCIATHTYTHKYNEIYKSTEAYLKDMEKCNDVIKTAIGQNSFSYVRMPGGSDNLVSNSKTLNEIRTFLKKKNINYVDWNISSGDAGGNYVEALKIKQNIMFQSANKSMAVVLMHDSFYKETTVDSLQEVISNFKQRGYVFRTFNDLTKEERDKMIKKGVLNR